MVVIAVELVSLVTLSSGILYVLQELIKPMDGFVNHIRSSVIIHLRTWTWPWSDHKWSCLRKGGLVTWLYEMNLIIMSILGRLHGFKIIRIIILLFASDSVASKSVCIWLKQIVNTFLQTFEPTCQQQNTTSQMKALSSFSLGQWAANSWDWVSVSSLRLQGRPGYNLG